MAGKLSTVNYSTTLQIGQVMPVNFRSSNREPVRPYSITESMQDWGNIRDSQINRDEKLGDIGRQQKVRDYYGGLNGGRPDPAALSAIDPRAGIGASKMNSEQAQMGTEQIAATKQVATHFTHSLKRAAQQYGVQPGTPEYQQLADKVYRSSPIYAQTMRNVAGIEDDPSKPIDWQAAENIADPTPEEQNQADIAQKVAEQQALQPGRLEIAKAQAGIQRANKDYVSPMEMQKYQDDRADSKRNYDQRERGIEATAINKPMQPGSPAALSASAEEMDALIKSAEPLLDASTGSGAGAMVDKMGNFIGQSTPGANAAAQLKVIGGNIVSRMPKPPGPASDRDIQLAIEQSAQLADPTVPAPQKKAALASLREINDRQIERSKQQGFSLPKNTPAQTFTAKPPKKPGFRTIFDKNKGVFFYHPEGG
jgi:hypothetical protein